MEAVDFKKVRKGPVANTVLVLGIECYTVSKSEKYQFK
jgi:hypothetical protein